MTHNYEGNAGIPLYAIKSISLKQKCVISVRRREHKVLNKEKHALGLCGSKSSFYLRLVARRAEAEEITGGPEGMTDMGARGGKACEDHTERG